MTYLKDFTACQTSGLRKLDEQLIARVRQLEPDALVSFAELDVRFDESVHPYLQLSAYKTLKLAIAERNVPMTVNSAYRTIAQQLVLYNHARKKRCGIVIAAYPGRSNHQSGLALDVQDAKSWEPFLERYGWKRLMPSDPVHFDFMGARRDIRALSVRAFQELWNYNNSADLLTVDGSLGPRTLSALQRTDSDGFASVVPTPPKRKKVNRYLWLDTPAMTGDDVNLVQQRLNQNGSKLLVDGVFGASTDRAVREFQSRQGLTADGIVGPTTLSELGIQFG